MMDGINSWSSFERQQLNDPNLSIPNAAGDIATDIAGDGPGIDALYVSSSSPNIAPAAATLLRHSGLTAPNNNIGNDGDGVESNNRNNEQEEEFRFRFHWMRPHPSLAFALEEDLLRREDTGDKEESTETERGNDKMPSKEEGMNNPAVESSKLMEAYRSSQMKKVCQDKDNDDNSTNNTSGAEPNSGNQQTNSAADTRNNNLPLEFPKLRINLANLIEPPLMSSWLPGEDDDIIGMSDSDAEGGGSIDE